MRTPGPWIYDGYGTDINGLLAGVASTSRSETDAEAKANARLIAAAPDLLEVAGQALNALLDYVPAMERTGATLGYGHHVIRTLRDAIAKAEGK